MLYDLSNFYQSDVWVKLTQIIRAERLNSEGFNVCEYCGKPIVKAYDCICHHIEYLTEENVNDASISLNPANIQLLHHKCHNIIHDKFGHSKRGIYIVYGSPLSGKTTWVNGVKSEGDLIVDLDSIWECVSGCERYVKPKRLNAAAFGVRDLLLDHIKYRRGKWSNAYIIGGYPLISERERLQRELCAELIYIESTKEECLQRLYLSDDKRDVVEWSNYICDWWDKYSPPRSA